MYLLKGGIIGNVYVM